MLSNWQLRHSLQAYNHLSPILATRSSQPTANNIPKSRSCNEWNKINTMYHALPRQLTLKLLCHMVLRRMKRECPSLSNRYNKPRIHESSLKTVIEECITLEIQAAKEEETQLIMDLLPTIGLAIQTLQGLECIKHLQTVIVLKMAPTLLQFGPVTTMNTFLAFYQTYHSLDDIPNPTIRTMEDEYPTVEECTKALHFHTVSLQKNQKLRYPHVYQMS